MAEQDSPLAPTEGCTEAQAEMLALYLKCTTECMEGVQKLPSAKFYNRQCEYLVEKLQKFVPIAGVVFDRLGASVDAERRIDVLKLALVLAKRIESFIKSCSDESFIQAAMALANMSKCVASIGFDLELCRIALCKVDGCTGRLTLNQVQAKYEDEVKEVEKKVLEDVKSLVTMVWHQLSEESLKNENQLMAIYLLQRLKRMDPTAPSISISADQGILGAMYKFVSPGMVIGRGGSATIYEATWLGTQVAKKTFVGRTSDFMMEAEILARFNHPNITSMFCCEIDRRSCSIIMERMDKDLHTLMLERCRGAGCDNRPFTFFEAVDIMLQIAEGVNYLHEEGICHRDLKSMNILVKSMLTPQSEVEVGYVHAKVADFGLSKAKSSTTTSNQTPNTGTTRWMAPEIMDGKSQVNTSRHPLKIDVYSFAMLCYEILTGYVPFHDEEDKTVRIKVKSGIRPELPNNCPPELKALIQLCWDKSPEKRPSFPVLCSKLKYVKYLLMTGFCSSEDTQASSSVESEKRIVEAMDFQVEPIPQVSDALTTIGYITEISSKFLINKHQCERLAARFGDIGEKLKEVAKGFVGASAELDSNKVEYPAFDLLLTVLKKGKALLSKYIESEASIPSVLTRSENRTAFEEIHADLDIMNSLFHFEDFEHTSEKTRSVALTEDAEKDIKEMSDSLDKLAPVLKNHVEDVKSVVSEKRSNTGDDELPSYLTISPAVVEISDPVRKPEKKSKHDPQETDGWALVHLGSWLGCKCALKIFKSGNITWNRSELLKEVCSLMKLHYPHVVQLMGFAQDDEQCLILMELMDTDLRHFMNQRHPPKTTPLHSGLGAGYHHPDSQRHVLLARTRIRARGAEMLQHPHQADWRLHRCQDL